jgi:cytochrome c oxidase assembly protein subunit 15
MIASKPGLDHERSLGWIHFWSCLLTIVTFPLIWLGGLVTTYDAGMAVPDWPGTFGYNLWLYPWATWIWGPWDLFVEHGHRLLATVVGLLAILLLVHAHRREPRTWVVVWCWGILAGVLAQGILGGLRVLFDDRTMAMVHGCTGPIFFAFASATTVMTSRWWRDEPSLRDLPASPAPRCRVSPTLVGVALCQLVVGAQLRHIQPWAKPSSFVFWVHLHLTLAGIVAILILWMAWRVHSEPFKRLERARGPSALLVVLVLVQIALGFVTWIVNYALPWPDWIPGLAGYTIQGKGWWESWVVTGHQATGSLILAVASVLALRIARQNAILLSNSKLST